jgi:hypothetical protein
LTSSGRQDRHHSQIVIDARLRQHKNIAELLIKAHGNIAGYFKMLFLVFTNRYNICLKHQNVGSHQHRIGKKPVLASIPGDLVLV